MRASKLIILIFMMVTSHLQADSEVPSIGALDEANGAATYYRAAATAVEAKAKVESLRGGTPPLTAVVVVETPKGKELFAVFSTNGGRIESTEGDTIPGGYTVKKINETQNRVMLVKGKNTMWVGFSNPSKQQR